MFFARSRRRCSACIVTLESSSDFRGELRFTETAHERLEKH